MKTLTTLFTEDRITNNRKRFFKRHAIKMNRFERQTLRLRKIKNFLELTIIFLFILSGLGLVVQPKMVPVSPRTESFSPGTFENFGIKTERGSITLSWVPDKNQKTDYYMILKSDQGQTFEPIGLRKGEAAEKDGVFHFTDTQPYHGISYYKLYRMERGGSGGYSKVKSASVEDHIYAIKKLFTGSF
jgi:hypothetical protein